MMGNIVDILCEINIAVVKNLCAVQDCSTTVLPPLVPRLILPGLRNGATRISEQESRVIFCSILDRTYGCFYSIETPTEEVYSFNGKTPVSARSDLSLWEFGNGFQKTANIELKAHNPAQDMLTKDIEKLVREKVAGNWFHTLKSIDSGTLPSLFRKLSTAFLQVNQREYCPIVFSFCVLDFNWGIMKVFEPSGQQLSSYVKEFFRFDYLVTKNKVTVNNSYGWKVIENFI